MEEWGKRSALVQKATLHCNWILVLPREHRLNASWKKILVSSLW